MQLIDTHTHIYLAEFDEDRETMLERARAAGVQTFLMPAIDASTHADMLLLEQNDGSCLSMMGLHPCSVKENFEAELSIVEGYLHQRKFMAVGEIGLDFYWDKTYTSQQYEAFHRQIDMAMKRNLPISIHSRNATEECLAVVQQYPGLRGVFHCFSGNLQQAEAVMATGFFLGIGGVVSFKNAGLDKVIEKLGLSKLVLETDAPYLAPVPYRGKRNEPAYLRLIAEKIASLCQCTVEEVAGVTTENARNLFGL